MNLKTVKLCPYADDDEGLTTDWEGWYHTNNPNVFVECHETWDNIVYRDEEETDPCYGTVYYSLYEVSRWPDGIIAGIREVDGGVMGYEKGDTLQDLQDFMIAYGQHYDIMDKVNKTLGQYLDELE